MKHLVSLVFLLTLLGAFGRVEVFSGYPVYLYEPILGLVFLLEIKRVLKSKENLLLFQNLLIFVGYLLLRTGLSLGTAYDLKGFLYILRFGFYLFGFLAFKGLFSQKEVGVFLKRHLRTFLFLFLFVNLLQYAFFRNLQPFKYIGWDPHFGRLVGPFLDPFLTASLLGILFFLAARFKYAAFSVFLFLSLLLTNSRAGILAFLLGLFSTRYFRTVFFKFRKIVVLLPFLIFLAFLLNPGVAGNPLRMETVVSRVEDYKKGIELVRKNPLFGVGYNRLLEFREETKKVFKYSTGPYTPQGSFHSPYLTLLAVGGVVGLLAFLQFFMRLFKLYSFPEFFVFIGIFSLFDNVLLHPLVLLYLAASLALLRGSDNG